MNPFTHLKVFLQKLQKPGGTKRLDPSTDWLILLGFALLFIVASLAWNTWFFFTVLDQKAAQPVMTSEQASTTNPMEKSRTLFEIRATEEARYRSEYRFIDPSK
jgi:hypothetical protein